METASFPKPQQSVSAELIRELVSFAEVRWVLSEPGSAV
jgi:hypothetical protein